MVVLLFLFMFLVVRWKYVIAEIRIGNPIKHPDYAGTLTIPSVEIDVPLILVEDPDMLQMVVDKTNCTALFKKSDGAVNGREYGVAWIIGDHSSQNFENLQKVELGKEAEIVCSDGTVRKFVVTKNFVGYNIGSDLIYEDGTSVRKENPDGVILYACVDETAVPVYIVILQPV